MAAWRRHLTIIDEALAGIVEQNQIRGEQLRQVLGYVGPELAQAFPEVTLALRTILKVLDQLTQHSLADDTEDKRTLTTSKIVWRAVHDGRLTFPEVYRMGPLREAMRTLPYDNIVLQKVSVADRQRIAEKVDQTLRNCEAILARWAYYYRKGRDGTLNSSQLLIPDELPGPVVLDATASQNILWLLMGDRALISDIPKNTRNYANVKIHVARARGLGKTKMKARGQDRLPRLLTNLEKTLGPSRSVLLCCHKLLEARAKSYDPKFGRYSVAHWGAIDGKNDWSDHDTAVIFGLPYLDQVWSTNMFFALQGLQDNDWMRKPRWRQYDNIGKEMQVRQLTVSIVQAINRVRCRRVIDEQGNCPPTDIFIVLPEDRTGDVILKHLKDEMPGIVVGTWDLVLEGPSVKIRKGSCHEAVLAHMMHQLPGETSLQAICKELSLSGSAIKDLKATLRHNNHPLTRALAEVGVAYVIFGKGRGARALLLKQG